MQDRIYKNASDSIEYQFYFDKLTEMREMAEEMAEIERPNIIAKAEARFPNSKPTLVVKKIAVSMGITAYIQKLLRESNYDYIYKKCCDILDAEKKARDEKKAAYAAQFTQSVEDENRNSFNQFRAARKSRR